MKSENHVLEIIKSLGFEAKKIEESDQKSPDFFVQGNQSSYLIELKTKFDNPEKAKKRIKALNAGEIAENSEKLSRRNRLSGIINDAMVQLSNRKEQVDFKLVWLHARGKNFGSQTEQMEATLYGSTNIVDLDGDKSKSITCYYFTFSDFYKCRDIIDGAIVSTENKGKLCLNTHSPRYEKLKKSELCKAFEGGVCDPIQKEMQQKAYIVDSDIDRRDKGKVLSYIQKKYGNKRLVDINMTYYSASVLLSTD